MKHSYKLAATIVIGIIALILQFIFGQPVIAQILVTGLGALMAFSMLIEMITTLRSGKYGIDLLAIMAIVATLAVGEYWASLLVLVMLTGGDSLEDYAAQRAGLELKSLLDNSPQIAHQLVNDQLTDIPVTAVKVGDYLVVKPGEIVPVDGHVLSGVSSFNEASLTGEARPIEKPVGAELLSGSLNGDISVTMVVDQIAANSQYQAIIKLVKQSEAQPAHFVRMADRYAVPFTLISLLIAGAAWVFSGDPVRFAEVLVVASPCPLILAAPIALVAGMSRASRNGIIVKTGTTIEKLARARTIAFDKTGTITQGQLTVAKVVPLAHLSAAELLQLAASAEQQSSHILARSLVNYVGTTELLPLSHLTEVTGAGVTADVAAHHVKVGKLNYVAPQVTKSPTQQTAIHVVVDETYVGYIEFSDQVRPEAAATITRLRQLGLQQVMMLTGDQATTAQTIAQAVGVDEVHAGCLPQDKINLLKAVAPEQQPVIMVGDGVNDAPSLTAADVGIAMGAHGATAASESADAVILKDDLSRVARAVTIAQETMRIAKGDVLTGIVILVILMLIAATGVIPALLGALFQEAVDTITILLALRARRDRQPVVPTLSVN
ncbi:cadmium-translocating P-type ATPase [Loigolactobacillus coryniformis]|uniref:heavy metal translocating P-type ATPase n=1 Tax=Loigolactobacillus coryniformis TaxID=1610 RepID=UPI0023409766|nr:heavy metal translocating P-type ATPase [Loigolactobacillus coryniformis]MDC4187056.1 cadmium-translocating P-type ATPase [Loigolactobacillus coryniformis]MDN5950710.1 cadmium-translocating P-type ATPase [Loigolactobacillus coryniformis]MDN5953209.1 cadmium-translocating P-type ATPase [Loigolactobacillus coryniformis]